MKKLWLLTLLLIGCSGTSVVDSKNTIKTNEYKVYENVSCSYDQELHYVVELPNSDDKYIVDIDYVYYVRRGYVGLHNKFYLGNPNRLVIYNEYH